MTGNEEKPIINPDDERRHLFTRVAEEFALLQLARETKDINNTIRHERNMNSFLDTAFDLGYVSVEVAA